MGIRRVVIDTDVAIGISERDVDDALAIVMAANSSNVEICGITLTYGNDCVENTERCMMELSAVAGLSHIKVAKGARSCKDLDRYTGATALFAKLAEEGPLTVLCLGPATNLAAFLSLRKELLEQIEEVVLVAGRRHGQRFLTGNYPKSHPDLNFEKDPEAMRRLLDCGAKLVFAPFEVSSKVWITDKTLDLVERSGTPLARYLADRCSPWLSFWKRTFSTELYSVNGFNPFDCLAVAWLSDRDLLMWENVSMHIEEDDYDTGEKMVQGGSGKKFYLNAEQSTDGKSIYIFDVEREVFLRRLVARLR